MEKNWFYTEETKNYFVYGSLLSEAAENYSISLQLGSSV